MDDNILSDGQPIKPMPGDDEDMTPASPVIPADDEEETEDDVKIPVSHNEAESEDWDDEEEDGETATNKPMTDSGKDEPEEM